MPVDETNLLLPEASVPPKDTSRLFEPEKLLRLSEWVRRRSQSVQEKFSCVPEDEQVKHKKTNDTKASITKRQERKRGTQTTPDKADSTISGQNAVHNQPTRGQDLE